MQRAPGSRRVRDLLVRPRRTTFHALLPLAVVCCAVFALLVPLSSRAAELPSGFQQQLVFSGLTKPTAVRFAPDGRVFVAEKSGIIKVFDNVGDSTPTTFADLRTSVYNYWDRGLLGLAVDPAFPVRPYVYALYAHDAEPGGTAPRWGTAGATGDSCPQLPGGNVDGCVVTGRLSRLTANGNVMDGSEHVLIEDFCQQFPSHSVGDLVFGGDGALYASAGDGANFGYVDYGQSGGSANSPTPRNPCGDPPGAPGTALVPPLAEGGALRAQDLRTPSDATGLDGTVLRLNPLTGEGLPDNPLARDGDANVRRIAAYGLRNPLRLAARPGSDEIWAGDVGWNTWEEINRIADPSGPQPLNFGWPCYEGSASGSARQGGFDGADLALCETLYGQPGAVTEPVYSYRHDTAVVPGEPCSTAGSSVTGLAYYDAGNYPSTYRGALFLADYSRGCIWALLRGANGQPDPATRMTFATATPNPVDLQVGAGGDLYYVDHLNGRVWRIRYFNGNQPPIAAASASAESGPAPLTVQLDGRASSDPEGGALSYSWDLDGDGAFGDAAGAQVSKTYSVPGIYNVRLRVTDGQGASADSLALQISAGNTPPTVAINSPAMATAWRVGDTIRFAGSAVDVQDGDLPAERLSWSVVMHHCTTPTACHAHAIEEFDGVASGSFAAPDHEYPSWIELQLTATDRAGLRSSTSARLEPQTAVLTAQSEPAGLELSMGSRSGPAPLSQTVIVGSTNTIGAPATQQSGTTTYTFERWLDDTAVHRTIVAGAAPTTFTAHYRASGAPPVPTNRVFVPLAQ